MKKVNRRFCFLLVRGGYAAPSVYRLWIVKLLLLPISLFGWLRFQLTWFWRFSVRREKYSDEEKWYLIKKLLRNHGKGMSEEQLDDMPEEEKERMMSRELWIRSNFEAFKAEEEEKSRERNATSSKMRRFRRFMKNNQSRQANVFEGD